VWEHARVSGPARKRWRAIAHATIGAGRRTFTAATVHPVIAGTIAAVAGGLIVFALTDQEAVQSSHGAQPIASAPSCEPAIRFKGFGDFDRPGLRMVRPQPGTYNGQIAGGDVLRVSRRAKGDFSDSVTVELGAKVTVGLRLSNPSYETVGMVRVRIDYPERATSAIELKATVAWWGVSGFTRTTDVATIFVSPSRSRACARYVSQSTRERVGDGPRMPVGLDWIGAEKEAYVGDFGGGIDETRFIYFTVIVI